MSVALLSNSTVNIFRENITQDSLGGITRSWGIVSSGEKMRLQQTSTTARNALNKDESMLAYNGYTAYSGIVPGDRIEVSGTAIQLFLDVVDTWNVNFVDDYYKVKLEGRDQ